MQINFTNIKVLFAREYASTCMRARAVVVSHTISKQEFVVVCRKKQFFYKSSIVKDMTKNIKIQKTLIFSLKKIIFPHR